MDATIYKPASQVTNGSSLALQQYNHSQSSRRDEQLAKVSNYMYLPENPSEYIWGITHWFPK